MRLLILTVCGLLLAGCGKPDAPTAPTPSSPESRQTTAPQGSPMPDRPWLKEGPVEHGISLYGPQDLRKGPDEPYAHANPDAPKGGTLRIAELGAFEKLNPLSLKGNPAPGLALLFETLVDDSMDPDEFFAQYANIAERIVLAEDRLSITYHLNTAARFSDGEMLDADDVVFSFNLVQDPEYIPMYKSYFADVKACEKVDAHTVRFVFGKYNQELPLIVGQLLILPQHVYGAEGKVFGRDFDEMAVGSGPYVVDSYDLGKYISYKRNPDWWAK
ncbi:MAG: microcin C transport system substrate-binding protein, partial [Rhodothermales bacterium]